jgi:hypothetical protein
MNDLSHMSWEPCICKHGAHYDDPFISTTIQYKTKPPLLKPILMYDTKTLQITDYKSAFIAAEAINADAANIRRSANRKYIVNGRWIFGFTIQGLFDNMKANGLT